MDKLQGVLFGIQLLAAMAVICFGATAMLAVWDSAARFQPLHGFIQNLGFAFMAVALSFLASYFRKKP